MGFQKGNPGRPKGSKNKRTRQAEEIMSCFRLDPLEMLMMVVNYDWKGLGYECETRTAFTAAGIEFEEPVISLSDRVSAAKEAVKYRYSALKSIEYTAADPLENLTPEEKLKALKMAAKLLEESIKNGTGAL